MKTTRIAAIVTLLVFLYIALKNVMGSVFLRRDDKVNLVFYGEETRLISIDDKDVDYIVPFSPEATVLVPGGYGEYRVGALNKLVDLEGRPELFRQTFSAVTSSMVDLYFYPPEAKIFYEEEREQGFTPSFREIFFSKSNAGMLDRILTFINLSAQGKKTYTFIDPEEERQGVFYKKTYRNEGLNVQIIYTKSYKTAELLSKILDGEGIRVVDLTQDDKANKVCELVVKRERVDSKTTLGLKNFFGCEVKEGSPPVSDIILKLGSLEDSWLVN